MAAPRVAITQRVDVVPGRDERRDALDQAWCRLLVCCGALPVPIPNQLADVAAFLEALSVDAVLLTGGNDLPGPDGAAPDAPERDACERAILQWCGEHDTPLVGVCRGMQFLVQAHGGRLRPVSNHVARPHELRVSADAPPEISARTVNSFHDYGALTEDVGDELEILAHAPDGVVEMVRHRSLPRWGLMWHPERAPTDPRDVQLLTRLLELSPCTT